MNPYEVLKVAKTATQDEIKAAYRKLAKKLHPDLNPGNKGAETKFKEVNRAYEMIGTEEARGKYDRGKTTDQQQAQQNPFYYYETQNPGSRYSTNFEGFDASMFEDLFGGMGGRGGKGRSGPAPKQDAHYSMDVDFNLSILGGEREITLPTGKKIKVKIPPGVKSGQKLRLAKVDEGDAYIEINVHPSDLFRRLENDIEVDLSLSLNEAVLGGEVRVPTVDGAVMLKVPAGLSTGSRVRVKGKGVPLKDGRGDQYAVIRIVMPAKIDGDLENFIREWSKTHAYNPREGQTK